MSGSRSAGPGLLRLTLPATSANLGPGFDAAGLAISLSLQIEAMRSDAFTIEATGRDAALTGALPNNLILMTYGEVLGDMGLPVPPLSLRVHNEIPLGMGCGSSAAAICAGVLLAEHFGELRWTKQQVLDEAVRREGHPDNVAACLQGGMTVSRVLSAAVSREMLKTVTASFGHELRWRLLLALPNASLSTKEARALLPPSYSRADAVLNVQATALLVSAFALGRPELLAAGTEDRLHQPYRARLCPLFSRLRTLQEVDGVYSVTLSGAGPAVLLVVADGFDDAAVRVAAKGEMSELLAVSVAGGAMTGLQTGQAIAGSR